MLSFKLCGSVFSGNIEARLLKLGIDMNNESFDSWNKNRTHSYISLFVNVFFSFFLLGG